MPMSATQRTIRALRSKGIKCAIVEKWNPHIRIRQDMFGIIDIVALDPIRGVGGVQSCGQSFSAHYKKLTEEKFQETLDWVSTPHVWFELWGWRKIKKKRGGKVMVWSPRVLEITLDTLTNGDF